MSAGIFGMSGAALVLGLSAVGAAMGMGIAGAAAIGAAKRCFKANRPVPMLMLTFAGFPLTEVVYGFIITQQMLGTAVTADNAGELFGLGIGAGLAMALVGIAEGKAGAAACDSLSDTGKGVAFYVGILGIIETVALFAMVFTIMMNLG
ncbi:MAG: V-type ATP synthase subunit K [Planctomycetota bacterium]|nr:V-type ATP synthase subunit K [Planctomycetota bacterium]